MEPPSPIGASPKTVLTTRLTANIVLANVIAAEVFVFGHSSLPSLQGRGDMMLARFADFLGDQSRMGKHRKITRSIANE